MSEKQGKEAPVNPYYAATPAKKMVTLVGIYVAVIGSIVQSSSLSTLLPVAVGELGGMEYYSLANTLSGILSVAVMPLWGYLGAKYPAIKPQLFAASLLVGTAVVCARAFAPSMVWIVIPSAFYGLVSAGIFVLGYSIIRDMYDKAKAGMYLGLSGTMMSAGMLVGPVVAGAIMDASSWRMMCHVIWPLLALGAVMVLFGVRVGKEEAACMARRGGRFDAAGAVAVVVFLTALITGISLGASFLPFGSAGSNILFAVAGLALVALVSIISKKQERAFIPAPVLKNPNVLCFFVSNFFTMFSNMALFFFLPMYIISAMGYSAVEAGLSTTLYSVMGLFLSPVFGKMVGRSGNARGILTFGCILRMAVALALLFFLAPDMSIFVAYVVMFAAGLYRPVQSSGYSAGPMIQVPEKLRVQGNSIIQVGQNLGSAIGTAVYGAILGIYGVAQGMPIALIVSIVAAAVAMLFTLKLKKLEE